MPKERYIEGVGAPGDYSIDLIVDDAPAGTYGFTLKAGQKSPSAVGSRAVEP